MVNINHIYVYIYIHHILTIYMNHNFFSKPWWMDLTIVFPSPFCVRIGEALEHLYVVFDGMVLRPKKHLGWWGILLLRNGDKTHGYNMTETWHDMLWHVITSYKVFMINSGIYLLLWWLIVMTCGMIGWW